MRTETTVRPSRLQTGALQLGASVRGLLYGFAIMVVAPLAWTAGEPLVAVLIGGVVIFAMFAEALLHSRNDEARPNRR